MHTCIWLKYICILFTRQKNTKMKETFKCVYNVSPCWTFCVNLPLVGHQWTVNWNIIAFSENSIQSFKPKKQSSYIQNQPFECRLLWKLENIGPIVVIIASTTTLTKVLFNHFQTLFFSSILKFCPSHLDRIISKSSILIAFCVEIDSNSAIKNCHFGSIFEIYR